MGIQNLSEDVILVVLPEQPHLSYELETINEIAAKRSECDVIIDLYHVQMLTSETVCSLMILNRQLGGSARGGEAGRRRLILCNVSHAVRHIFTLTGLDAVFTFADDRLGALQRLNRASAVVHPTI